MIAQDTTVFDRAVSLPDKFLSVITKKTSTIDLKLNKQAAKYLSSFKKKEERIYRKLAKKDSLRAAEYLAESQAKYAEFHKRLSEKSFSVPYNIYLDSLSTSLKFFDSKTSLLKAGDFNQLADAKKQMGQLQQSIGKAEEIRKFLKARRSQLKDRLSNTPLARELKSINKEVYYYTAQVREYKELLKDKSKREKKAMELLANSKQFQEFMRKNSMLAGMFRVPGGGDDNGVSLQGLQTRSQVSNLLRQRFGNDANAIQSMRENVQAAQAQLNSIKQKAASLKSGSYGNGTDFDVPDNFKVNSQKTKSFWKRISLGTDVQTQKARYFFPVTSDVAITVGYKLNDKSIIGIGTSYKLGLGTGWRNIDLSHQGIGFRSFIDYKLKGSFYLAGGYEQNYRSEIRSIDQLQDYSAWQSSGLLGLSKKYKINKKFNGEIKLLWDFLSYQQVPRGQPILFRIGYTLK